MVSGTIKASNCFYSPLTLLNSRASSLPWPPCGQVFCAGRESSPLSRNLESGFVQSLIQILQQIINGLYPDGQADQIPAYTGFQLFSLRQLLVGG